MGQMRAILLNSWINVLLVLVPAGFAVRYVFGPSLPTFVVNFLAIYTPFQSRLSMQWLN